MGRLAAVIAGIAVLAVVGWMVFGSSDEATTVDDGQSQTSQNEDENATRPADGVSPDDVAFYTPAQVAEHDSENDCWTYINGKVYDLTDYIPSHPGGDEILRACGTDGTMLFETRTTEEGEAIGPGVGHSPTAENILEGLYIGELQTL